MYFPNPAQQATSSVNLVAGYSPTLPPAMPWHADTQMPAMSHAMSE